MSARPFAREIETSDVDWLRHRLDEEDDVDLVELDEVEFWGKTYEETPSGLYLPTDLSAEQRAIERAVHDAKEKERRPTVLDLFAGAGGFSLGMEHAGFDVVCGVEWDLFAAMTYLTNLGHPGCRIAFDGPETEAKWQKLHVKEAKKRPKDDPHPKNWIGSAYRQTVRDLGREGMRSKREWMTEEPNEYVRELNDPHEFNPDGGALGFYIGDIRKTNGAALLELAGVDRIDVIVGGPPCQGLSTANARACTGDPRNALLWEYLRLVEELAPAPFIIENVPQLLTVAKGALFNALCARANKAGYDIVAQKINAAWHGVPQHRVRALIVGQREGMPAYQFPMPSTWALGRQANGKSWSMDDDVSEPGEEAIYDEETKTFSAPAPRPPAPSSELDLFGEDA